MSEENTEEKPAEEAKSESPAAPEQKKGKLLQKEPPVTVGRIVHFTQHEGEDPHAALVVKVWGPNMVNLDVVDPSGHHYTAQSVSKGTGPGQWRYPARVES